MSDFIHFPRSWLDTRIIEANDFLKAAVYLTTQIEDNGSVDFNSADALRMFGMSRRRYRTFMAILQNGQQTAIKTTNKTANISFDIQRVAQSERPTKRPTKRPTNGQQKSADLQHKSKKFTPPTEQDIAQYVIEKGFHFDPASFIPFYESKGWKVGNQPMKNWRAACQTWECRWKEKYGEQFYYQVQTNTLAGKAERYSMLEQATDTILCNATCFNSDQDDNGRYSQPLGNT